MIGIDTTFLIQYELAEMPANKTARQLLRNKIINEHQQIALTPQILNEFIHVVTDTRRFEKPLNAAEALRRAQLWWNDDNAIRLYPTAESMTLFFNWMHKYNLGRKRLLDTQLAAIFRAHGIRQVFTSNARDFRIFECFEIISPEDQQ